MLQPLQAGDLVISTALASRGTDIAVSETVENLSDGGGGLHVLITYLPSNSRVERQIVGRTGRKGLSGSTKTIVCMERLTEELGEVENDRKKIYERRNLREAQRVARLKKYLVAIKFKDDLFEIFCDKLTEFKDWFQPTMLEQKNDFSNKRRKELLHTLKSKNRRLDFPSCIDALKEESLQPRLVKLFTKLFPAAFRPERDTLKPFFSHFAPLAKPKETTEMTIEMAFCINQAVRLNVPVTRPLNPSMHDAMPSSMSFIPNPLKVPAL